MNEKLIYQGPYPRISVDGFRFVRGAVTEIPSELKSRLMAGQNGLPASAKRDFVSPPPDKPKPSARVAV